MKKILMVALGVALCGSVMAATPTPTPSVTPTVTPTPVPDIVPEWSADEIPVALRANFSELTTGAITDQKLINLRTGQSFTVPSDHKLYVTDIHWSLQSSVIGSLEWDGTYSDVLFDRMYAPYSGQGKVIQLYTPITSLDPGISPVLTTDKGCTGFVYIGGYLK